MRVVVAGIGKVGRFIAQDLIGQGHEVVVIERQLQVQARMGDTMAVRWVVGDACELATLRRAGLSDVDVAIAATGDDEDNLVFSLLCKQEFGVGEVIARVNSPRNEPLFTDAWGVDTAVSLSHLMTATVGEKVSVGRVVRLLSLERGSVRLVELTLAAGSPVVGRPVTDLGLPRDATIVAVVRDQHVLVPSAQTVLEVGDELLAVVTAEAEETLRTLLEQTR